MLMCGVVCVSPIWMHWTDMRDAELMGSMARAFRIHGWPSPFNQGKP